VAHQPFRTLDQLGLATTWQAFVPEAVIIKSHLIWPGNDQNIITRAAITLKIPAASHFSKVKK
jgi:hypothetical protein